MKDVARPARPLLDEGEKTDATTRAKRIRLAAATFSVLVGVATIVGTVVAIASYMQTDAEPNSPTDQSPGTSVAGSDPSSSARSGSAVATSLTSELDTPPRRLTVSLAGEQVPAVGYVLYPKGCPNDSLEALARLDGQYTTLTASFSLDDTTAASVRTSLTVAVDGIVQEPRILSAETGKSFDIDLAGKNLLSLSLATLGTSSVTCVDAGYVVALSGNLLP